MSGAGIVGSKYEATKDLRTVEIAKLVRADLSAAFPKSDGWRFSVTCDGFAGAKSIRVKVVGVPAGFVVDNPRYDDRSPAPDDRCWQSAEARAVRASLVALLDAYNYDHSDIQTDYFCVRFYSHVDFRLKTPASIAEVAP